MPPKYLWKATTAACATYAKTVQGSILPVTVLYRKPATTIVAFNDDDALPDPNWLRVLLRNFADPLVVCVTGLTMPMELETEAQEWFERCSSFVRGFTRTVYDQTRLHPLAAGKVGAGANMA